jgi:hypothetical protein
LVERSGAGPNASSARGMHGTGRGARYFWPTSTAVRPVSDGWGGVSLRQISEAAALVSLQRASGGEMRSPIRRRRPAPSAAPRRASEPRGTHTHGPGMESAVARAALELCWIRRLSFVRGFV